VIVAALPTDRWLARTLAIAEAALRRNQWTPTPLPQLLRLADDRRTVLVNDAAALAAAVAAAMDDIQTRLTSATPESHYLWDTHSGRPKSEDEISNYLANELKRVLTVSGAIVNREVQIRRSRPSGIGERTDLLVDAALGGGVNTGRISLPIEVKGAWNSELRTAIRDQLVERYMRDTVSDDGMYVVAWPDLEGWTDLADSRRSALASLDRDAVEAELAAQVSALAQSRTDRRFDSSEAHAWLRQGSPESAEPWPRRCQPPRRRLAGGCHRHRCLLPRARAPSGAPRPPARNRIRGGNDHAGPNTSPATAGREAPPGG
jgi:hypothetical protein